jgi:hypothetical protein
VIQLFDEPFITFYEHERDGKSFVCLGDDCPLCEIGDEPRYRESDGSGEQKQRCITAGRGRPTLAGRCPPG